MHEQLRLEIQPQPDDTTCGPTCLHAVYRYFGDGISLEEVIRETPKLDHGGTLAGLLGTHALQRGYQATLYTFDLDVFDPTWFRPYQKSPGQHGGEACVSLIDKLKAEQQARKSTRIDLACEAYIEFLELGGRILMRDLSSQLIRDFLRRAIPILTGLSSTYLYRHPREINPANVDDDVRGVPQGHFVVLCGYDTQHRLVEVADPYERNPLGEAHYYTVGLSRLVCAILLGALTLDANLLLIEPQSTQEPPP